jgi:hypothetical protein
MPRAKNPLTPEEQHRRFVEGARELGTDTPEAEAEFERAVKKIVKPKPKEPERKGG